MLEQRSRWIKLSAVIAGLLAGTFLSGGTCSQPTEPEITTEPPEFTPALDRGFRSVDEGWEMTGTLTIDWDTTAPQSPPFVGQIIYPAGCADGCDPGGTFADIRGHGFTRLYVSFWVKTSENWQPHLTGVNKLGFIWMHSDPVVVPMMLAVLDSVNGDTLYHPEIGLQDMPDTVRQLQGNGVAVQLFPAQWHRWEILLIANEGDLRDGQVHWWVDGVKVGEYRDVTFGSADQSKIWQYVAWRPIWGGRGDTLLQTTFMWMDHLYASGAP